MQDHNHNQKSLTSWGYKIFIFIFLLSTITLSTAQLEIFGNNKDGAIELNPQTTTQISTNSSSNETEYWQGYTPTSYINAVLNGEYIRRDGTNSPTANINFNGYNLTNVGNICYSNGTGCIPSETLIFTSPNLNKQGTNVSFDNFAIGLSNTGRGTIPHNNAFNSSDFTFVTYATMPTGSATFTITKGEITDAFFIWIQISTTGNIVATLKKTPETVTATGSGVLTDYNLHEIAVTYAQSGDKRLRLFVDGVLKGTSAAISTGTANSNTKDFLFDIGAGQAYFTRPTFSNTSRWTSNYTKNYTMINDANTVFYFPMSEGEGNPNSTIGSYTMTLNSEATWQFGKYLPRGVDYDLRSVFDLNNNKIGNNFYWDLAGTPAMINPTILNWESSDWINFVSIEDETDEVWGNFNFQDPQTFQSSIQLPTSGTIPTCNSGLKNGISGNATGTYGCNGSCWGSTAGCGIRLF